LPQLKTASPVSGSTARAQNCLRLFPRHFFDVHPARRRRHHHRAALGAVNDHAEVELALDGQRLFHQHAPNDSPLRPRLVRHQRLAQHGRGVTLGFIGRLRLRMPPLPRHRRESAP
jgi:hypothetical protein